MEHCNQATAPRVKSIRLYERQRMKLERWQQIERIYHAALDREAGQRGSFLAEACAGDDLLRRDVEQLLQANERLGSFLGEPAIEIEAREVAAEKSGSLVGQRIGHYQIVARAGAGGMGEVYLAKDSTLNRRVALKLLPARFTTDPDRIRRFVLEAQAASALNHPNIFTIHAIGQYEGSHYIVTEFIEGQTLRQRMGKETLPLQTALDIAIQITSALNAAHQAGIMHRDIKPENVMVRPDGIVKVLDFGLAKLTEHSSPTADTNAVTLVEMSTELGVLLGTPQYMSPEQARGQKVDARSDLFSLGVMLYEMLTGKPPFQGSNTIEVLSAILEHDPAPFSQHQLMVPTKLEQSIRRALRKNCALRYQKAEDLLNDLREVQSELVSKAKPLATAELPISDAVSAKSLYPPVRSKRLLIAIAAGILLLCAAMAYFLLKPTPTVPKLATGEFSELFLDLGRWTPPPSGWTIIDERLHIEDQPRIGFPAGMSFGDFTMTFHLKLTNAGGAAWALRIKDPDDYYLFYLAGPESNQKDLSYFYAYIVRAGKLGHPISSIPVTTKLTAGGEYTINITARKNEITHSINSADDPSADSLGDPLGYFKDEDSTYMIGGIGFRTVGSERFSVDELYVRPLEIQAPR